MTTAGTATRGEAGGPDALDEMVGAVATGRYALRDFTALTDGEIEALYAAAYGHLDGGRAEQAERLFVMLCRLDHFQGRFWLGLGASRQVRRMYEPAALAYAMAGIHDPGNPVVELRAAECYLALGKTAEAERGATAAVAGSQGRPEHAATAARAAMMLAGLRRKAAGPQMKEAV